MFIIRSHGAGGNIFGMCRETRMFCRSTGMTLARHAQLTWPKREKKKILCRGTQSIHCLLSLDWLEFVVLPHIEAFPAFSCRESRADVEVRWRSSSESDIKIVESEVLIGRVRRPARAGGWLYPFGIKILYQELFWNTGFWKRNTTEETVSWTQSNVDWATDADIFPPRMVAEPRG